MEYSELNKGQLRAAEAICDWYIDPDSRQYFKLGGLAGTGKTSILQPIMNKLGIRNPWYAAYTGKAARVLQRKGAPKASTIHSLIYEIEKTEPVLKFKKRHELEADVDVIIIDEASMVNKEIHHDLLSFGVPIIYVGDFAQLPPINGTFNLMRESKLDAKLTKIHRQKKGNSIIELALAIRNGDELPHSSKDGRFKKIRVTSLRDESLLAADQILTGRNNTRKSLNKLVRRLMKYTDDFPMQGEKIIILNNDKELQIFNGQQMRLIESAREINRLVIKAKLVDDYVWDDYVSLDNNLDIGTVDISNLIRKIKVPEGFRVYNLDFAREFYEESEFELKPDKRVQSDFAYAITVHKAQGSEWNRVILYDDYMAMNDEDFRRKFLYTAVTRASEQLIWAY